MNGTEFNWLVTPVRTATGLRVRLARTGMLTLAVGVFCAAALYLPIRPPAFTSVATVAAPAAATLDDAAQAGWPQALARMWVLVPHLLPRGR